jgi:hypothetical protein
MTEEKASVFTFVEHISAGFNARYSSSSGL